MNDCRCGRAAAWVLLGLAFLLPRRAAAQVTTLRGANPNASSLDVDRGAAALWQDLVRLHTRASLIMFTAHPDDEDGGLLAYEGRFVGADTSLFSLNRGEGGQNVMSADFWDQLGLVRTQELLAADRYYGAHQYFSRVADFGFTKTKQEALEKWGYDRVLYDSVRVVRMTRPLVVTSVFAGNVSDGHGQHQVAGQMAQEVYRAAADPKVFPDQIHAGLLPWAPLKVYVRLPFAPVTVKGVYDYATGQWAPARFRNYVAHTWIEGKPSATLTVPEGAFNPALGQSAIQLGRRGLNEQKSQNGGIAIPEPGPQFTGYHLYASRVPAADRETTLFDGIDVSLTGIAGYAPGSQSDWIRRRLQGINESVESAMRKFRAESPEAVAPDLADGLAKTNALIAEVRSSATLPQDARYNILHELSTKREQFNRALAEALGLSVHAVVSPDVQPGFFSYFHGAAETLQTAIPGDRFHVRIHIANQGKLPVEVRQVSLQTHPDTDWRLSAESNPPATLGMRDATDIRFQAQVPQDATITRPYFSRPDFEQPYYDISAPKYLNLPLMPYPLSARATFRFHGVDVVLNRVVQTVHRQQGIGPVQQPLTVSPAISVWVSPKAGIVPIASRSVSVSVVIRSNVKAEARGEVVLHLPPGWRSSPERAEFHAASEGSEQSIDFSVIPQSVQARTYAISAEAAYNGESYTSGSITVGYPGVRPYFYYRPARFRATGVDVNVPSGLRVGYVTGTGDSVPGSLRELGLSPEFLSAQDLTTGNLSTYSAIILGVRAYAARPELPAVNARLLEYVHNGGTLIVQYNTPEFDHNYGPYPLQLTSNPEKVIDERSKVTILDPTYPAMTWPNRITVHDFDGWVEERGHGFMHGWDPRYTAPTETSDPGQAPQRGGLLVARYGKGFYVYDGYALYRQLPEGVPGAFRIFANLLSLSANAGMRSLPQPGGK